MLNRISSVLHQALVLIALLFSSMTLAQDLPPLTHHLTKIKQPFALPALALPNMDDEMVDISDMKGKVIVINFWATWCPPCRREMGSLERLHQATRHKGVEVLAVNVGEDLDTVFSFLGTIEPQPSFQMLFDEEGGSMEAWKVRGLPTTYVIGPDGKMVYRAVGGREFDHPDIVQKILELSR